MSLSPDFYCPDCDVFDFEPHEHTPAEAVAIQARELRAVADKLWSEGRKQEATDTHYRAHQLELRALKLKEIEDGKRA